MASRNKGRTLSEKKREYTAKEEELLSRKGYSMAEINKRAATGPSAYKAKKKKKKKPPTSDLSAWTSADNLRQRATKADKY